jgi:predicted transcriptional regulator
VLDRGSFHGLHLYWSRVSRARVVAAWVRDFAHGVLEVDPAPVVAMVADSGALDDGEVDELRSLLAGDEDEEP